MLLTVVACSSQFTVTETPEHTGLFSFSFAVCHAVVTGDRVYAAGGRGVVMRFLVDECTGPAVARWLQEEGYEVF